VAVGKALSIALVCVAPLIAAWVIGGSVLILSIVVLPFAFVLPGALLISLVTPRPSFDFEYLTLAVGLSLAVIVVVGLGLHFIGFLNAVGWGVFITLISLCAVWRNSNLMIGYCKAIEALFVAKNRGRIVVCAAVLGLMASSIAVASNGARQHRPFAYTELWLRPYDGRDLQRVLIGVRNQEKATLRYELEVLADDRILVRLPPFHLLEGEQRVEDLPIPTEWTGHGRLEARLYRLDQPTLIYRRAWLSALVKGS
jgi:uncharacterized membrane protein